MTPNTARDTLAAALSSCRARCLDDDDDLQAVMERLQAALEPALRAQYTAGYRDGIQLAVDLIRKQG